MILNVHWQPAMIWNPGGGPSSKIVFVCGPNNRVLRKSAFGMTFYKAPVSITLSMLNSRNPLENIALCVYFSMIDLLIVLQTS